MTEAERVGKNEAIFREVNERIEEVSVSFLNLDTDWAAAEHPTVDFVCECSAVECTNQITLTLPIYEQIRSNPRRFVVAPGHEDIEFERVVERMDDYVVVEKLGEAARVAEEQDPRS